jgi:hypothetical protein
MEEFRFDRTWNLNQSSVSLLRRNESLGCSLPRAIVWNMRQCCLLVLVTDLLLALLLGARCAAYKLLYILIGRSFYVNDDFVRTFVVWGESYSKFSGYQLRFFELGRHAHNSSIGMQSKFYAFCVRDLNDPAQLKPITLPVEVQIRILNFMIVYEWDFRRDRSI